MSDKNLNEEWTIMSFHPMDIAGLLALIGWVCFFLWVCS